MKKSRSTAKSQPDSSGSTPAAKPAAKPAEKPAAGATTETKKIRYAVIGLGNIAQSAVLPGFANAANSELAALVSGDAKKLQALKRKYPQVQTFAYDDLDTCLQDPEIDAVYVALPNDMHYEVVLRAAEAGKHILCEKPFACDVRSAEEMVRAAEEHGVRLMVAYRLHFEPATLATIELIRSGQLGEPRYFNSSFSYQVTDADNIRLQGVRGGGPIFDIGVYCLNAARHFFDDEPKEVSAFLSLTGDPRFQDVEASGAVILRFPRGRLAAFTVSFDAADVSRAELVGTKGRVVLEPAYEYSEALKQIVTIDGKPETKEFAHTDQFGGEIEVFSQCILDDSEPEASGEEAIADLRVIDAIFESAASGRAVRLPPFTRRQKPEPAQVKIKPPGSEPEPVDADSPQS